jgi:tRNA-modifying protein YgfZ
LQSQAVFYDLWLTTYGGFDCYNPGMFDFAWMPSSALRLTGSDRIAFLHGQTTNDIRGLPTPGVCRALLLNAKGQIEFDVRVYRRADDLYVHGGPGLAQALFERLKRYIVFDDVQLEDISAKIRVLHIAGDSLEFVKNLGFAFEGAAVQLLETNAGLILTARIERGLPNGFDLHILDSKAGALDLSGGLELNPEALEVARVLAGLPDAHNDDWLGRLPQECGLEGAISYRKGCYIGQEIMARLEARGNTRYELRRVTLNDQVVRGSSITFEGRQVGQLGQVVPQGSSFAALAVLRRDVDPASASSAALEAAGVRLQPV